MGTIVIPLGESPGAVLAFGLEAVDTGRYIRVVTPPAKTLYSEGDTIDFTGIVVKAYEKDGSYVTGYADGVIPFSELRFPVTVAHYEEGGE